MHYKSSHLDYQCSTIIFDDGNIAIVIVIKQGYTIDTDSSKLYTVYFI